MNTQRQASLGLRVASLIFASVAVAHFARVLIGWEIRIDRYFIGNDLSAALGFIAAGLALWLWKLAVGLDQGTGGPSAEK